MFRQEHFQFQISHSKIGSDFFFRWHQMQAVVRLQSKSIGKSVEI